MRSVIGDRLLRYRVSTMPGAVCGWCRHAKGLHRGFRECQAKGCLCLRVGADDLVVKR